MPDNLHVIHEGQSFSKKTKYKPKINSFSIPADISRDFNSFCKENGMNKSQVVTKLIETYLKNAGVREK